MLGRLRQVMCLLVLAGHQPHPPTPGVAAGVVQRIARPVRACPGSIRFDAVGLELPWALNCLRYLIDQ